jgi:Mg2+ and Co2+ transporter CorA
MDVWFVQSEGLGTHRVDEIDALLRRTDGFTWIDVPQWDEAAERLLADTFQCHPLVLRACARRNRVPTLHGYDRHVLLVLHAPLAAGDGHVHLLELDQVVARRYLITTHGPVNPVVDASEALRETEGVRARIEAGRFHPASPAALSHAISSAVVRRQLDVVRDVAERLPELEQQVMAGDFRRPDELLERLFLIRHELLIARTMAAQSAEVWARMESLERLADQDERKLAGDLREQFERVRSIADGESQFLFGVIDLYQTRATTKMTLAMERLAVIAAVTLPVTAIASVYGMNVIVNDRTHVTQLLLVLLLMATISGLLLHWTKRQGWW